MHRPPNPDWLEPQKADRIEAAARAFLALDDGNVAAHGCMDKESWDALEELYNSLGLEFPWKREEDSVQSHLSK